MTPARWQHPPALVVCLVATLLPHRGDAMVIQRVFGANDSEVGHASAGGGTHVYLAGTDIGSAFAPPEVFIGINADARCVVQPFTSTKNRLHCIVNPKRLPYVAGESQKNELCPHKKNELTAMPSRDRPFLSSRVVQAHSRRVRPRRQGGAADATNLQGLTPRAVLAL